jgi:dolichol-phosphate mannosyltransferase
MDTLFIVLPCFNESAGLSRFWQDLEYQLKKIQQQENLKTVSIFVDDGSTDSTWNIITELRATPETEVIGLRLVKNFGHQAAIQAGCERIVRHPNYDAKSLIVIMDSDGQHPPEAISGMITQLRSGARHIQMVRQERTYSWWKRTSSNAFYRCFRFLSDIEMPAGAADFRGFTGAVLANYLKFGETGRFNRGLFYLADPPEFTPYEVQPRKFGTSKYSVRAMMRFAFFGLTYFSNRPLLLVSLASAVFGFLVCVAYISYMVRSYLNGIAFQPGWFTIIAWVSFWGMLLSFCILLMSVYLARVFEETKKRPVYLIREETQSA